MNGQPSPATGGDSCLLIVASLIIIAVIILFAYVGAA